MTITIAAVNALQHARDIKELFRTHERPEFPDFFDRTYPAAFADGATSWLGRDPAGRLVMHIACFSRRFQFRGRQAVAGLVANLMVAREHRSFFPALALVNRLVQDSSARGGMDFLYADPNDAARGLIRRTRFVRIGTVRRYVLPVRARRRYRDLGVVLLHTFVRATHGAPRRARVVPHPAGRFQAEPFWTPPVSPRLTPYHDQALYVSRLKGYPGERDWWFTGQRDGITRRPEAALLLRGPDASGLAALHAARWTSPRPRAGPLSLASLLPGLISELRHRGWRRLQVTTVAESALGGALRRCGFIPRSDTVPLYALALTPLGEECIRSVQDWEITDLDCDR